MYELSSVIQRSSRAERGKMSCPETWYTHMNAINAPLTCKAMTYTYSLCDSICGQDLYTLTRLGLINRPLPMALTFRIKHAQVPPHPPNHPLVPVHLVLPGSSSLCPTLRLPGGMLPVRAFIRVISRLYLTLTLHVAATIRHVSASPLSLELRRLACSRAVAPLMLKKRQCFGPHCAAGRRREQVIVHYLS
jgi:hypothetical protein